MQSSLKTTDSVVGQFLRYLLVGGLAFLIDFGCLSLLAGFFQVHYLLAAALAFALGLITNYLLSIFWVFNQHAIRSKSLEFLIFALVGVVGLGLNELVIYVGVAYVALHYLLAKVIATALTLLWNFVARKVLLFQSAGTHPAGEGLSPAVNLV